MRAEDCFGKDWEHLQFLHVSLFIIFDHGRAEGKLRPNFPGTFARLSEGYRAWISEWRGTLSHLDEDKAKNRDVIGPVWTFSGFYREFRMEDDDELFIHAEFPHCNNTRFCARSPSEGQFSVFPSWGQSGSVLLTIGAISTMGFPLHCCIRVDCQSQRFARAMTAGVKG